RVRREHPEVVRFLRPQPALDPHGHRGVVHRRLDYLGVLRPDHQLKVHSQPEHLLMLTERDDRELVLRLSERRALLLADADHAEMPSCDGDGLVERFRLPEQSIGDAPAKNSYRPDGIHFRWIDQTAPLDIEGREVDVVAGDALHLNAVERFGSICHLRTGIRLARNSTDVVAELPDGLRLDHREPGIVPDALLVFLRADYRRPLNREV